MSGIIRRPLLSAGMDARQIDRVESYEIRFAPGQKGGLHFHPCPVTGYIVSGTAVLQVDGEAPQVLPAGSSFFEPPEARILRFDNHSDAEPLVFIAFYLLNGSQNLIEMLPERSEPITRLFAAADARDWAAALGTMAPQVRLDYTSLAGGSPATLTPEQITGAWAALLPGFDRTHHELSAFAAPEDAPVTFHGHAEHWLDGDQWTVDGDYEADVVQIDGAWKISSLTLHLKSQCGNTSLPAVAAAKVKAATPRPLPNPPR